MSKIKKIYHGDKPEVITRIEQYLFACRDWFWNGIKSDMEYSPKISGYTTTRNCIEQNYPYEAAIASMLDFCDEVVVVDGGSTDGTWGILQALARDNEKLVIHQEVRNWNDKRFAVYDGLQKAVARDLCTGDFCWQQDSDEIVHEEDGPKIRDILSAFPHNLDLLALPVIEYWGSADKVRCDVHPWKWRLSRNKANITHGIPANLRQTDDEGNVYAKQGTDGCDYIDKETGGIIPFANFYTADVEMARRQSMNNEEVRSQYELWFNQCVNQLPGVFHFSWYDMERKIKTYRDYWGKHWKSLFDIEVVDTAENNMMFDVPWSEVSDKMIAERAKVFCEEMGGWVWHSKWNGQKTPHIKCNRALPKYIEEWINEEN